MTAVKYTGIALPLSTDEHTLFSTVDAGLPANFFPAYGISRFVLDFKHDENFTLNWYKSDDRGATWVQMGTEAITVTASATTTRDVFVEGLADWEVRIVNGGTNQAVWQVDMSTTKERSPASV